MVRELRVEYQGAVYHLVSRGNEREMLLLAARIGLGVLKALAMPSKVKRKTSADCCAQSIRVIAKWAHEAGNPKNEGLTPSTCFVWTAKVEDIVQTVSKCKAILETLH